MSPTQEELLQFPFGHVVAFAASRARMVVNRYAPGPNAPNGITLSSDVEMAAHTRGRKTVKEYRFEEIAPNQVCERLQRLDRYLTPASGLREVGAGSMAPREPARPVADGRILLFIHGTFSNCDTLLAEFAATASRRDFLAWATSGTFYNQVLTFDHPTLSVSPFLNAVDLARAVDGTRAQIDVICHSRGGLITRWWLEMLTLVGT